MCVKVKTRQHYLRECALCSEDLDNGERIVRCHASMNVVIDVRAVECHANTHDVIGVRIVLCHPLVHNCVFSILCPNSHFLSYCNNSS